MALSRGLSAVVVNSESHFGRPRSVSRSDSLSSSDSVSSQPRGMPIHIRRPPLYAAPPPLPPPQYLPEIERGNDIGHNIGYKLAYNEQKGNDPLPSIPEGSSLRGGFSRPVQTRHYKHAMDVDEETGRRLSSSSMVQPAHSEGGAGAHAANVARRAPSPTNSSTMLQGEFPLAQESHDRSNRDYDHAMLSKIGKPNSPPRPGRTDSSDGPVASQKLSLQTKESKGQRSAGAEPSSAVGSVAPWITSPTSTGVSPVPRWQDQNGLRSPPMEGILDPELFVQSRSTQQHAVNGHGQGQDDTPNLSARNSYDPAMYTPAESENTEEPGLYRSTAEPAHSLSRRTSSTGMKRKALSPPGDRMSEGGSRQDLNPLRVRVTSKSPNASYQSGSGSISSAASSVQPQSYSSTTPFSASSAPFSAAASSMTSISSFDTSSPRDQTFLPSYITSGQPVASPVSSLAPRKLQEKLLPRKLSVQTSSMSPRPTRIGNSYICACCPKKPKKFDTEEQLRNHENEKQYSCNFCHNRFKNKNEAERHQNSLHLRRHSWSCAALINFQAAFSPSGAVDSSSTATDACGYCGEEFPNHPAPNWDHRLEHLTNVHKFGECNSAKKFFRADHFRQHLKHSHAGRSGKWTNILEHACVRDEEPAGLSASTADHNLARGPTGLSGPSDMPVGINMVRGPQDDGA